jgi:HPt (histidine-containing phosphotransfer) domain-containing protein
MLKSLSNDDESFIIDMLQTFKRTAPPILQRMEEYAAEMKYEAVGREAHKMIPGVSFLGAHDLKSVLVTIEESAKKNEGLDSLSTLVASAVDMAHKLMECFEADFPGKLS